MSNGPSPFEVISSINEKTSNMVLDGKISNDKEYNSFMTNRGMSYFNDTVMFAQELNVRPDIPPLVQYLFLHSAVKKRKRFSKWYKKVDNVDDKEIISIIMKEYKYSREKANIIVKILQPYQKDFIINDNSIGKGVRL